MLPSLSILAPDLWNASYDGLLRLDMPEESRLADYADDIAALVAGRAVEQVQMQTWHIDATGKLMVSALRWKKSK